MRTMTRKRSEVDRRNDLPRVHLLSMHTRWCRGAWKIGGGGAGVGLKGKAAPTCNEEEEL
jgi:hypothetical protein